MNWFSNPPTSLMIIKSVENHEGRIGALNNKWFFGKDLLLLVAFKNNRWLGGTSLFSLPEQHVFEKTWSHALNVLIQSGLFSAKMHLNSRTSIFCSKNSVNARYEDPRIFSPPSLLTLDAKKCPCKAYCFHQICNATFSNALIRRTVQCIGEDNNWSHGISTEVPVLGKHVAI